MVRCQMNFKRLSLTDIKIDIKRVPKKTTLIKAMEEAGDQLLLPPFFQFICFHYDHCLNGQYPDCRCEKQVGEELVGQEAYCPEEESITQRL